MMGLRVSIAAALAACALPALAQESSDRPASPPSAREFPTYDIRGRGWYADLRGDARGDGNDVGGTEFDLREDAGLDERDIA
jgi:hypothetical protein